VAGPRPAAGPRGWGRWGRAARRPLVILTLGALLLAPALLPRLLVPLLPMVVSQKWGGSCRIGRVEFGRGDGGTLIVELHRLEMDASPRASSGDPSLAPLPFQALRIDRLRLEADGWWALRRGLPAIRSVEAGVLEARLLAPGAASGEASGGDALPLLSVIAPERLPELPFPVHVSELLLDRGDISLRGGVTSLRGATGAPLGVELDIESLRGVDGIQRGRLRWEPDSEAVARFALVTEPLPIVIEGTLTREEDGWELWIPAGSGPGSILHLSAGIPLRAEQALELGFQVEVYSPDDVLAALDLPRPREFPDFISLRWDLRGNGPSWSATGDLRTSHADFQLSGEVAAVEGVPTLLVRASGVDLPLERVLAPFLPAQEPRGLADLEGWVEWGDSGPRFGGSLDLMEGTIALGGGAIEFERWASLASWTPGERIRMDASVLDLGIGKVELGGWVPTGAPQEWDGEVDVVGLPLESLGTILGRAGLRGARGSLGVRGRIRGPLTDPEIEAEGSLRGGELAPSGWERVRDIDADLVWRGREVRLDGLTATIGGGAVEGEGVVAFSRGTLERLDTRLRFDGVRLLRTESLRVRGSGGLRLHGGIDDPRLEGSLTITRGIYDQDIHPSLGGSGTELPFDLFRFEEGFLSRLGFEVTIDLAGNFEIRNNRVEVSPHGRVRLEGTGYQPLLVGAITASEGRLLLPRVAFDIAQVEVRFPEEDPFRPRVRFVGRTLTRGIEIEAVADGGLFAPQVRFTSSPTLPEEDLLLLVATGRMRDQILSDEVGLIAATELARLYGPQVWAGLFGDSGGSNGLLERIEIGVRTTEDTGELDGVTVEMRLDEGVSVIAEQAGAGESAADVLFYWWFP